MKAPPRSSRIAHPKTAPSDNGHRTIAGIVIYCSDPRTDKANLWKDIKALLIPPNERFTPIGMLGAPVALARPADFPVKFAAIMEDIYFALEEFSKPRILIVGHDCGIYRRLSPREFNIADKKDDLAVAAKFLRGRFRGIPVSSFFKDAKACEFEKIA
jgi:hypothetical protein